MHRHHKEPSGTALYIALHTCLICQNVRIHDKTMIRIHFDQLELCCTGCKESNFQWMLPSVFEVHALNEIKLKADLLGGWVTLGEQAVG